MSRLTNFLHLHLHIFLFSSPPLSLLQTPLLQDALSDAEKFHRATHMMLEWLTEAERQLQVANATPLSGATPGSAPRTADEENAIEAALEAAKNFK